MRPPESRILPPSSAAAFRRSEQQSLFRPKRRRLSRPKGRETKSNPFFCRLCRGKNSSQPESVWLCQARFGLRLPFLKPSVAGSKILVFRGGGMLLPRPLVVVFMRLTVASVGQPGTASGTATGQNLAPVGGGHALAEPMHLGTLTLFGLIGTNHSDTPPVSISSGRTRQPQRPNCPGRGRLMQAITKTHDYVKIIIAEKPVPCQP